MPPAAARNVRSQPKHGMSARRRCFVQLGTYTVHAQHCLAVRSPLVFQGEFELPHLRHDVGDKGCAIAKQFVIAKVQGEVAKSWPARAMKNFGARRMKRGVVFHRVPTRWADPRTSFADQTPHDWVDEGVGQFINNILARHEFYLAQPARCKQIPAASPVPIETAGEAGIEMMGKVRGVTVWIEDDEVIVVRHDDEANDAHAAKRCRVGERIKEQRNGLRVGFEQKLSHRATPGQEVVHARQGESWAHVPSQCGTCANAKFAKSCDVEIASSAYRTVETRVARDSHA